jgi:hypothetical protein
MQKVCVSDLPFCLFTLGPYFASMELDIVVITPPAHYYYVSAPVVVMLTMCTQNPKP